MQKLAITGATGFVGRHVLRAALESGHSVSAWVRSVEKLADFEDPNLEIIQWQADEHLEGKHQLDGVDAVIHLAAFLPPSYSAPEHAEQCFRVNTMGTLKLLESSQKAGVSKFIYISSGNIYRPGMAAATEDAPTYPSWRAPYYLTSKLAAGVAVDHFRQQNAFDSTIILRPSAIYGPGMSSGVIPYFAQRLLKGKAIEVSDGGRHEVDFVYVYDVVQAIEKSLSCESSDCFNVGSGRRHSILELARTLSDICDASEEQISVVPAANTDTPPKGFSGLDITHIRDTLGYEPTDFSVGLRQFVDHLRCDGER